MKKIRSDTNGFSEKLSKMSTDELKQEQLRIINEMLREAGEPEVHDVSILDKDYRIVPTPPVPAKKKKNFWQRWKEAMEF